MLRGKCCPFLWEIFFHLVLEIVGSDQREMLSFFLGEFLFLRFDLSVFEVQAKADAAFSSVKI